VTSPPYWGLRDYGAEGQIGLEATPDEYVAELVRVFREVRRVLRADGTLWLNLGDTYSSQGGAKQAGQYEGMRVADADWQRARPPMQGLAPKNLIGIPWHVAFALQADGWILRSDIIWAKPNPMPESVGDRPTKAHEYLFLLSKSPLYYYNTDAIREPYETADRRGPRRPYASGSASSYQNGQHIPMLGPQAGLPLHPLGRNKRSVWTVVSAPYTGAHFAVFPPALIEPCILAGTPAKCCAICGAPWRTTEPGCEHESGKFRPALVLDPFFGSGTVGEVAEKHGRCWLGFDINADYKRLQDARTAQRSLPGVAT
jgi:DNA modification methylase